MKGKTFFALFIMTLFLGLVITGCAERLTSSEKISGTENSNQKESGNGTGVDDVFSDTNATPPVIPG